MLYWCIKEERQRPYKFKSIEIFVEQRIFGRGFFQEAPSIAAENRMQLK